MGDGSTLNVTNSLGSVNSVPNPFGLTLGNVTLPTTGTKTVTFNVATGAQNPVNLTLGTFDDGSFGPATINFTGGGFTTLIGGGNLTNPQINVTGGGTFIITSGQGLGSSGRVNVASGSTMIIANVSTVDSLTGTGTVQLAQGTNIGNLTIGSSGNLSSVTSQHVHRHAASCKTAAAR